MTHVKTPIFSKAEGGGKMTFVRRMLGAICVGALTLFANILTAQADDATQQAAAESLIKAFIGLCVQTVPNLDRVEAAARISSWEEFKGDSAKLIAPQNTSAEAKSWMVQGVAVTPFIIAISRGMYKGKWISVCAVINPYAPMLPIRLALEKFLELRNPISQDRSGGSRPLFGAYTPARMIF
ncbi:MAG: hypothetical protein M3178_04895 [Pseudomonadota bacterium]|nr:hypothetical protein [Pseudomonadota bacterium]